jgi:putative transposase
LKERGLCGVRLITSDKCIGLVEALGEFFPDATWQRCTVQLYHNVLKDVPRSKSREAAAMLKVVLAQEDLGAAMTKANAIGEKLTRCVFLQPPSASPQV